MTRTIEEINAKIKAGKVVVATAEEVVGLVREKGVKAATQAVDVVTTGTFGPMCSSGVYFNIRQSTPKIKCGGGKVAFNGVPAYAGWAAADLLLGCTAVSEEDPRNAVYPGLFSYGGAHVIQDLVQGKVDNFEVGIAQEITGLTPGSSYVFSAECYKTGGSYSTYIAVRDGVGYNSNMGTTAGTAFPGTTGAWVSQQVTGTVSASGSVTVYLWVKRLSGSTADIYFDNASFMGR